MLELRKMNYEDIVEQWKYVTALPKDENGLTNQYEGISFDEYKNTVLPELMMYENPINMSDWFVPETFQNHRHFPHHQPASIRGMACKYLLSTGFCTGHCVGR